MHMPTYGKYYYQYVWFLWHQKDILPLPLNMEESMILGEVGALETSVEESVDLADHITSLADANAEANVPKSPSASDTSGQEILLSLLCETLPSPDCERTKQSWAKEYLN